MRKKLYRIRCLSDFENLKNYALGSLSLSRSRLFFPYIYVKVLRDVYYI